MRKRPAHLRAFTVVELLVVIGIVAALAGILLPALTAARENARTVQCLGNLRQLAQAAQAYCADFDGSYPIAQYRAAAPGGFKIYAWDFATTVTGGGQTDVTPGLLGWGGNE